MRSSKAQPDPLQSEIWHAKWLRVKPQALAVDPISQRTARAQALCSVLVSDTYSNSRLRTHPATMDESKTQFSHRECGYEVLNCPGKCVVCRYKLRLELKMHLQCRV